MTPRDPSLIVLLPSGTARPAAAEFYELYQLKLAQVTTPYDLMTPPRDPHTLVAISYQVPTHRPNIRQDMPSRLYIDGPSKLR